MLNNPRPWTSGRAVFVYNAKARSMILALKGQDWHDLIAPFAHWMLRRGAEIFPPFPCAHSNSTALATAMVPTV
jgi:predicted amidophosphoribosyltransferase